MGRRLLNLGLIVLLGPALVAFAYHGVRFILSVFTWEAGMWFLAGAGLSLLAYFVLLNGKIAFIEDLLHELEHSLVAFLFSFQLPTQMEIDTTNNSSVNTSTRGGCLTTLAPYYLPLLMLPFLALKAAATLAASWLDVTFPTVLAVSLDVLIGATLAFHYVVTIKEYGDFQTDIQKEGRIASLVMALFLNLAFLIVTMAVVVGAYTELWAYVQTAAAATVEAYKSAYAYVTTRLLPALGDLLDSALAWLYERRNPTPVP
jgi:hypothetical protein